MIFYLFFFIIFSKFFISNQEKDIDSAEPCGQYGFRCIDEKYFQVCTYPDGDGQTEQSEIIHECQDRNICDEDNPAYCSPLNTLADYLPNHKNVVKRKKSMGKKIKSMERQVSDEVDHYEGKTLWNNYYPKALVQNKNEINTTIVMALKKREDDEFHCVKYGFFAGIIN